jgi:hypothetical protein
VTTVADPLGRLAAATLKLLAHEQLVKAYKDRVESLEKSSLEQVASERKLLDGLTRQLSTEFELLRALPGGDRDRQLDEFETLVDDVIWESASVLLPELESKYQSQDDLIRQVSAQCNAWESQVAELARVVDGARLDGVPFGALEQDLRGVRARLASLRSALIERLYGDLQHQRDEAEQAITGFAQLVRQAEQQVRRVKSVVKQADLLIMQTRAGADDFEYWVLLRCGDRTQTSGINIIQDKVQVSGADRKDLMARVNALTSGINRRLRSEHAARHDTAGARTITAADDATVGASAGAAAPVDLGPQIANLGRYMLRLVIPYQMHEHLRLRDWSFSVTTNDLELPWELICFDEPDDGGGDENQFLCLNKSVSRMPLGERFPQLRRRRRPDATQTRRMLLIHSDPNGNLPAAAVEVETIATALAEVAGRLGGLLEIVRIGPADATNARLNEVLMEEPPFDFIHFAGHARFDAKRPGQSGLVLKDGVLTADKIDRVCRGGSLVFLNACESGAVAHDSDAQQVSYLLKNPDLVVGLASAFLYKGSLACVGSLWPVYDQAAAALAVKFYTYVLEGDPTGEALRRARVEIRSEFPGGSTWAGYVLYGDPTFRLTEG